ncbi:alpha/beta hydrolase [Streptomyces sp. NPDC002577]
MVHNLLTPEVFEQLRGLGRAFTPEAIDANIGLFAQLQAQHEFAAPRIQRDIAYGPDPRHRLDVHRGADDTTDAPVLVFVHGGGFTGGDKMLEGMPFYDNVGGWAARNGMVAVTITYRLAPLHRWPAAAQDIDAAVNWVRDDIESYGGDPARIVVTGQSAGAAHVASYLAGHGGTRTDGVAGAVLLSGIFEPASAEQNPPLYANYTDDAEQQKAASAIDGLLGCGVPLLIGLAEFDMPDFHQQAIALLDAARRRTGVIPQFVTVPGHTHLSEILSLGMDDAAFGTMLARFVGSLGPRS